MEDTNLINVYHATFVGKSQYMEQGAQVVVHERVRVFDSPDRAGEERAGRKAAASLTIGKHGEEPWFAIFYTNALADIRYCRTKRG
jgi:hypothetical protein